jgi:hypothetical protein
MTTEDRSLYLAAFSALKKRYEKNGLKISHVHWSNGHMTGYASGKELEAAVDDPAPNPRGVAVDIQASLF